jgi:uncharacterized protein (DUF1330 family)
MGWVIRLIGLMVLVVLVATVVQHVRYQNLRHGVVGDAQSAFHSPGVFHVVTVFSPGPDQDLIGAVGEFVTLVRRQGGRPIYAGKIVATAIRSRQIPDMDWDAFVLVQYPSRSDYDEALAAPEYQELRGRFAGSYSLGMQRRPLLNLSLPVTLLTRRVIDVVFGRQDVYPFTPAEFPERPESELQQSLVERLLAEQAPGRDALVVLNFISQGDSAQRAANASYGSEMMSLMAEAGGGPMHMGRAVTLEGDAQFDQVVIVYYPGVVYFSEMLQSSFFNRIVKRKQLEDSLSAPSVPLLPGLDRSG